ncbi:transcriptional regulator, putative [Babesia ovata]|uniref:Transcriptional regulator, putative n=1 Tax=Babesia ovata TaxID=189622 RepID=A0A2H6K7L0_9APIC|nr:transcriptional regulator, putative [Babesia ovata]GBE58992.1 transcriptional regulator, putative [Babesia ovata]
MDALTRFRATFADQVLRDQERLNCPKLGSPDGIPQTNGNSVVVCFQTFAQRLHRPVVLHVVVAAKPLGEGFVAQHLADGAAVRRRGAADDEALQVTMQVAISQANQVVAQVLVEARLCEPRTRDDHGAGDLEINRVVQFLDHGLEK